MTATIDAPAWAARPRRKPFRDDLTTKTVLVDGRPGVLRRRRRGLPVLFLHGWGLDHRAYLRALRRLTAVGCHVIAPSLPGFGRHDELPRGSARSPGMPDWVDRFLDAIGVDEPVLVLGHSFGGGVATKLRPRPPERVRYLVAAQLRRRSASVRRAGRERPGRRATVCCDADARRAAPVGDGLSPPADAAGAYVEHVRHPIAGDAGRRRSPASPTCSAEMAALAERRLPVLVLWSDHDGVIPLTAFDTFCSTFGTDGHVVRGGHSWLLADPDVFGEVLDNVIHVQSARARRHGGDGERSRARVTCSRDDAAARRSRRGCSPACRRCGC